jgi:hypothetical protein
MAVASAANLDGAARSQEHAGPPRRPQRQRRSTQRPLVPRAIRDGNPQLKLRNAPIGRGGAAKGIGTRRRRDHSRRGASSIGVFSQRGHDPPRDGPGCACCRPAQCPRVAGRLWPAGACGLRADARRAPGWAAAGGTGGGLGARLEPRPRPRSRPGRRGGRPGGGVHGGGAGAGPRGCRTSGTTTPSTSLVRWMRYRQRLQDLPSKA